MTEYATQTGQARRKGDDRFQSASGRWEEQNQQMPWLLKGELYSLLRNWKVAILSYHEIYKSGSSSGSYTNMHTRTSGLLEQQTLTTHAAAVLYLTFSAKKASI